VVLNGFEKKRKRTGPLFVFAENNAGDGGVRYFRKGQNYLKFGRAKERRIILC